MNCPFYGHRIIGAPPLVISSGGNQCALVTSAHSPCWMEVAEARAPEWPECPRNPEFQAWVAGDIGASEPATLADVRLLRAAGDLHRMMQASGQRREAS